MIGQHSFRSREILLTTTCARNFRAHWHASLVEDLGGGSSRSTGKGFCLTTPAAYLWLLTGFERKAWSA